MKWKSNSYITKHIEAHVKLFPSSSKGTISVTSKLHCPKHIPVWNLSLLSRARLLYSNPKPLSSQQSCPANLLQEACASEAGPRLPQTVCAPTVQTQQSASTLSLAPTCPILHASHCVPCFPILSLCHPPCRELLPRQPRGTNPTRCPLPSSVKCRGWISGHPYCCVHRAHGRLWAQPSAACQSHTDLGLFCWPSCPQYLEQGPEHNQCSISIC